MCFFFFSSRRRHTRWPRDWSSDVCSSDLLRREREIIAPFPIGLAAVAVYIIPRAAYLLWFDRAPLTSAGLTEPRQLALITETTLAALVAALAFRSEERRVGKECTSRWGTD